MQTNNKNVVYKVYFICLKKRILFVIYLKREMILGQRPVIIKRAVIDRKGR